MSIGTTIKKLRRERNITQEMLADMVGVTACAISQWECDKTAPDISQIPILATIFEVSADILLEIDLTKSTRAREIDAFDKQCNFLFNKGKYKERLSLCRDMQRKYPNDETVLLHLMRALKTANEEEYYAEIIEIGENLLSSKDTEKRRVAIRCLCFTYESLGNHEKALQYAAMIPTNEDLFIHILKGKELLEHCQKYFGNLCIQIFQYINAIVYFNENEYSAEERHSICKKLYDIFHIIYEKSDFGYMEEDRLGRLCFRMAQDSAICGNEEKALAELEEMMAHFDKLESFEHINHSSLLVNKLYSDIKDIRKKDEENIYKIFARYLKRRMSSFEKISSSPRFIAIERALTEKSN
ncbi:MAG: helix-turn-helix domain-containing protein [Clostridia bacterium]|nr:helix-turn-helix domain-containing protein [Clostridia bacterium]